MRRTLNVILACLVTLIPFSASAQEETKPAPGSQETRPLSRSMQQQQNKMAKTSKIVTVLEQTKSPLVSFRMLFMTGSAQDPAGKEGVAALTASFLKHLEQIWPFMCPRIVASTTRADLS